jgi:hypothetical protein
VGGVVSATAKTRKQYASRRKITHPYQKYEANNAACASKSGNSDFQARLHGSAAADGDCAHLEKYRRGTPHYDRYSASATTIQSAERRRQARKHVSEKRRVRYHGGEQTSLPGQPAEHHHRHHHHHHHP